MLTGMVRRVCAPVLARAGAEWLGVGDAAEGGAVREALAAAGVGYEEQPRILVMCGLEGEDAEAVVGAWADAGCVGAAADGVAG